MSRTSKRKSRDTDKQDNDEDVDEVPSYVPEMSESVKNHGVRKLARLSKGRFSVRFLDSVHSISTIDGPSSSRISLTSRSGISRKSSTSSCSGKSANQTGSSHSSEPSLINKLFAQNDDNVFVQPTSAAPKRKKKSAQLLRYVEEEVEKLPKKPHFPRLADYIHPRFYDTLIEKMKPKYGIGTNAKAVQLAEYIHSKVEKISWSKESYPEEEVEQFKRVLARKNVVQTHYDFYLFCSRRLPEYFMIKAFPLFVIKNGKRQLRDCSNIFETILSSEENNS